MRQPRRAALNSLNGFASGCVFIDVVPGLTPPMLRFAIVINHLAGGVFVLGALLGFAWNVFGEAAPDGSPPLDPLLLTIFLIFGVIFLLTARSLQDLRVRRWLDLRRFLAKRRRLLHREGRAPAPGETDDKPDQS